jgi:hypothetical protein
VKALVALGRVEQARERCRALERRFPGGLMVPASRAAAFGAP